MIEGWNGMVDSRRETEDRRQETEDRRHSVLSCQRQRNDKKKCSSTGSVLESDFFSIFDFVISFGKRQNPAP